MRDRILKFLNQLDTFLIPRVEDGERLDLHVIGKAAVILFYGGDQTGAMTSDIDVVQISHPPRHLLTMALSEFGKDTAKAREHDLYLESVLNTIPPLSTSFVKRCKKMTSDWKVLELCRPDANDLAASKLKRYAPKDRANMRHLCDNRLIQPDHILYLIIKNSNRSPTF